MEKYPLPNETAIDRHLAICIRGFYKVSDQPKSDSSWLDHFAQWAYVKIGPFEAIGEREVKKMRPRMWEGIAQRKHWITDMIVSEKEHGFDIMLKGGVKKRDMEGRETIFSWAGSMDWVKYEDGNWLLQRYRVWLDEWSETYDGRLPPEAEYKLSFEDALVVKKEAERDHEINSARTHFGMDP